MVNKLVTVLADIRCAVFFMINLLLTGLKITGGDVLARITTDTTVVQTVMNRLYLWPPLLLLIGVVMVVLSSLKCHWWYGGCAAGGVAAYHFRSALARHLASGTRPACRWAVEAKRQLTLFIRLSFWAEYMQKIYPRAHVLMPLHGKLAGY